MRVGSSPQLSTYEIVLMPALAPSASSRIYLLAAHKEPGTLKWAEHRPIAGSRRRAELRT